jgi:hypothetical protein
MSEPLTNAILDKILHLIWRDLTGNQPILAPPRRAPPRHHRRVRQRAPRVVPLYWPMEPSPPHSSMSPLPPFGTPYTPNRSVDLERLTGPSEGITPFTRAGSSWWTSGMTQ